MSTADVAEGMERVFYDLHRRTSLLALRRTSHRARSLVEHSALVCAVCTFTVVLLCHRTFVYRGPSVGGTFGGGGLGGKVLDGLFASTRGAGGDSGEGSILGTKGGTLPAGCLRGVQGFDEAFDVLQIGIGHAGLEMSYAYTVPFDAHSDHGSMAVSCPANTANEDSSSSSCLHHQQQSDEPFAPLYSYSVTKGLLLLSPKIQRKHNVTVHHVVVSQTDPRCFGEPFLQNLVFSVVGPSTVAMNWILALNDGIGYVLPRTGHIVDLDRFSSEYYFWLPRPGEGAAETTRLNDQHDEYENGECRPQRGTGGGAAAGRGRSYVLFKLGVLSASLFLFFVTTTLVAFTLRETQDRMLNFTFQLQERVRNHAPVGRLIATHVLENMVFIPIMLGTIFFLIEFYGGDKFLAFIVFSMVWVCEVFSVISMRSMEGMHFFPRVFFLYFTLFHAYYFSCPFGFSYASLSSTVFFLLHSMLFFWNRYELPALLSESVNADSPRQMIGHRSPDATPVAANLPPPINTVLLESAGAAGGAAPQLLPRPLARHQNLPSFPSMSSLGRGSVAGGSNFLFQDGGHNDGDDGDDSSYMFFMNGEVVMHRDRNPRIGSPSPSPSPSIQSPSTIGEPESTPESTPESRPLNAAAVEAATEAASRAASGSLGSSSHAPAPEAERSPSSTRECIERRESSPQTPRMRNGPSPASNEVERASPSTAPPARLFPFPFWGQSVRPQDQESNLNER